MIKSTSAEARDIASEGDDFETALTDPAAYYADPEAIVADPGLSHAQKKRFLTEWEQDLTDRQVADQEGMTPTDPALQDADAELLNRIRMAIQTLETESDSEGPTPRRWWQRLRAA